MLFCKYKNIFGEPNKGVHKPKILGFAIIDIIGTIILAIIVAKIFRASFIKTLIILFVIGEVLHWLFCVDTAFIIMIKNVLTMLELK